MKLQKLVFGLAFILYSLTANTATVIDEPLKVNDCKVLVALNHAMQTNLKLSNGSKITSTILFIFLRHSSLVK